jgi:excisionase family DNA binding protein
MEDRWLSVDEVAEHLGIKRDTVYKWIVRNGLPARKLGRLWKFRRDEVDQWVNRQPGTPRHRGTRRTGGTAEA